MTRCVVPRPAPLAEQIAEARAEALARIGRTLELHLDELARTVEPARRAELRLEVGRWRWYLVVQREANGLVAHDDVDAAYPDPVAQAS